MRRASAVVLVVLAMAAGLLNVACNDANSVTVCRELESARCAQAPACGIDLGFPLHEGNSTSDNITACRLYYQDACLHGLVTPKSPTSTEVAQCLTAINHPGSCGVVLEPQTSPSCAWLIPPDAGVDAGHDAGVADAAADVVVVVVVVADTGVDTGNAALMECYGNCNSTCVGDPTCVSSCEATCNAG